MPSISNLNMIFHKIRIKLYPNYLQTGGGAYIARTNSEKTLSIEDVCSTMKTRAGFTGSYDTLLENVRQYYDEVAYQLCDGYTVNNSYYSVYPNIGGTFESVGEAFNRQKHSINFRFRAHSKLLNLIRQITVEVEGVADTSGYIDKFIDYEEDSASNIFLPGNQFAIHGHKIKLCGSGPEIGVYFVPVDDPAKAVKVERVAENSPTKITGIAPNTYHTYNRIEIRTQFSGSSDRLLKKPRTISSSFVVEAG